MTAFPRFLPAMFLCLILSSGSSQASPVNQALRADWPKVMVLPPVCENCGSETELQLGEEFQWKLVDVLHKYRYFRVVMQKEYEEYLQAHGMAGAQAVPDPVLAQMMDELKAIIYLRATISQPGGEGTELSARVTYVFPKDNYMKDDYVFSSGQLTVENEKKSWKLANKCLKVAMDHREQINLLRDALFAFNFALSPYIYEKAQISGNLKSALKKFEQLVKMEPQHAAFSYMAAMCLMELDRKDKAIARFHEIIAEIDSLYVPAHEKLANHYFTVGEFESALKHFSKLTEIAPEDYTYAKYRALSLSKLGRDEEAIVIYERLIGIEDSDPAVRHQMAEYYYEKSGKLDAAGKKEEAEALGNKALECITRCCELSNSEAAPDDPDWHTIHCARLNFLAMLQREFSGTGNDLKTLQQLVELDPAFPGALYNLGIYAHKAKEFDKALEYYARALEFADNAQKTSLNFQTGVIYLKESKKYSQAISAFGAALETSDTYMRSMAYLLRGTARYEYARELDYANDRVADIDALIASGTMKHERVERAAELYTKAEEDFRQAAEVNPGISRNVGQRIEEVAKAQRRLKKIRRNINFSNK